MADPQNSTLKKEPHELLIRLREVRIPSLGLCRCSDFSSDHVCARILSERVTCRQMPVPFCDWYAVRVSIRVIFQVGPLVQCIQNAVAMDLSANALLAVGASPAMVSAVEESPEFITKASALSINVGTLSRNL
jgi:hypothetical protein